MVMEYTVDVIVQMVLVLVDIFKAAIEVQQV